MDDPSDATQKNLVKQLEHLTKAYTSHIDDGIRVWNATQPGKVYGDTQKGFL